MQRTLILFRSYFLGLFYFSIIYLFEHLKRVGGIDWHIVPLDFINLTLFLITFPLLEALSPSKKATSKPTSSYIRKSFEEQGESFAQIQYAPAWSTHGTGSESGGWLFSFFLKFFIYCCSPILIIFKLVRTFK